MVGQGCASEWIECAWVVVRLVGDLTLVRGPLYTSRTLDIADITGRNGTVRDRAVDSACVTA